MVILPYMTNTLYKNRYYVGTHEGRPAVYDTQSGLRAYGGTVESMHQLMVGLAKDDELFAKGVPATPAVTADHGPTLEAGPTIREYYELKELEYQERQDYYDYIDDGRRARSRRAWLDYINDR